MSFRWLVFLFSLVLSLSAGCHSAPVRLSEQVDHQMGNLKPAHDLPEASPVTTDNVQLISFEETSPRPASMPVVEELRVSEAFTLADLEGIAFQNNPTLTKAAARIQVAHGQQIQAGLYPNPVVGYHGTEIGNLGTSGGEGGFISQRFITAGKLQLDQAIAGKEADEAHFRLHAQQQRVLSDVRVRFFEALIVQRRVELTRELMQIGENLVKATETLLENEQSTQNDLLQAEIRAENARILHDNATNESLEAWRRLVAVLGVPQLEVKPLIGEPDELVPDFDWEACYGGVLASHPEVNAALARVERARIAIARAKREPIPNIDVFVSVRHNDLTESDVANVQVGVPIPLFDKNQGNICSAEADWFAATREVERVALALQDRFAVVFRRYDNARQQVERYREKIIPKAERSLELVTQGYEKGQVEYLTLLTAQQTYFEATLSHLNALRELRVASVILEGKLLTGSLDPTMPVQ